MRTDSLLGLWRPNGSLTFNPRRVEAGGGDSSRQPGLGCAVTGVLGPPGEPAAGEEAACRLRERWGRSGPAALIELEGGFAAAIHDRGEGQLVLLRDPAGTRPLYWARGSEGLAFGSRIRSVMETAGLEPSLDPAGLVRYLAMIAVPDPGTIYQDVWQVPPGGRVEFSAWDREPSFHPWRPMEWAESAAGEESDRSDRRVRAALEDAVARSLVGSERPLSFLSGGYDSTVVAGLAHRVRPDLETLTIGFGGGSDYEPFNEFAYARAAAEFHGTRHREVTIPPEQVLESLPSLLWNLDQPSGDAINSYLVAGVAAETADLALTGTGGDEMFVGSGWFLAFWRQQDRLRRYRLLPEPLRGLFRRVMTSGGAAPLGSLRRRLAVLAEIDRGLHREYAHLKFVMRRPEREQLLQPQVVEAAAPAIPPEELVAGWAEETRAADPVSRLIHLLLRHEVAHLQCRDLEQMSRAHGLVARSPLVDSRLVTTMARIPGSRIASERRLRHLMARVFEDLIPKSTIQRRKHSFIVPMEVWARGPLRSIIQDACSGSATEARGLFRPEEVRRVVEGFYSGRVRHPFALWNLALFELWCRVHLDRAPDQGPPAGIGDLLRGDP